MKLVRCVPTIVAEYATTPNTGQVSQCTGQDLRNFFTPVCSGFLLACSSRVMGSPATSSGGAIMISITCWIM